MTVFATFARFAASTSGGQTHELSHSVTKIAYGQSRQLLPLIQQHKHVISLEVSMDDAVLMQKSEA
jgi:hypothetical protein